MSSTENFDLVTHFLDSPIFLPGRVYLPPPILSVAALMEDSQASVVDAAALQVCGTVIRGGGGDGMGGRMEINN